MAQSKYKNVRGVIAGMVTPSDFAIIDAAMNPTPTTPAVELSIGAVSVAVNATVAVSATYTDGASVSYTIDDTEIATVEGNEVTGVKVGETTITGVATKEGYEATTVTATVTVTA